MNTGDELEYIRRVNLIETYKQLSLDTKQTQGFRLQHGGTKESFVFERGELVSYELSGDLLFPES